MTTSPPRSAVSASKTGSLTAGKYADLVLLESNPLTTDAAKLGDIKISETWVNGAKVVIPAGESNQGSLGLQREIPQPTGGFFKCYFLPHLTPDRNRHYREHGSRRFHASGRGPNAPTNGRQDRDERGELVRRQDQRRKLFRFCEHDGANET